MKLAQLDYRKINAKVPVPVSVEAKLSFVEPVRRWAHSPSPSKPLVFLARYYENLRDDVKNLRRSLTVI